MKPQNLNNFQLSWQQEQTSRTSVNVFTNPTKVSCKDHLSASSNMLIEQEIHLLKSDLPLPKLPPKKQNWGCSIYDKQSSSHRLKDRSETEHIQKQVINPNKGCGLNVPRQNNSEVQIPLNALSVRTQVPANKYRNKNTSMMLSHCPLLFPPQSQTKNSSLNRNLSGLPQTQHQVTHESPKCCTSNVNSENNLQCAYLNKFCSSSCLPKILSSTQKGKLDCKLYSHRETWNNFEKYFNKSSKIIRNGPSLRSCSCKNLKCGQKISEIWQKQLYYKFWNMNSFIIRKKWFLNHISDLKRKRMTLRANNVRVKKWVISDQTGKNVEVCRMFFLRSLSYTWDSVLSLILKGVLPANKSICPSQLRLKYLYNKCENHLKRLIFVHIKSFLRKHQPLKKKSSCHFKYLYDYSLVKQSFHIFQVVHPHHSVPFWVFREIFSAVYAIFRDDDSFLSLMPSVTLLKQAYHKCYFSGGPLLHAPPFHHEAEVSSLQTKNLQNDAMVKTKSRSQCQMAETKCSSQCQGYAVKGNEKVIIKLIADNDAILVTKNASDTEIEEDEEYKNSMKTRTTKSAFCNKRIPTCDSQIITKISLEMEHSKEEVPLFAPCTCKRQCSTRLSESRRRDIHSLFLSLRDTERRQWLLRHIHKSDSQRRTRKRRRQTKSYILTDETDRPVVVCSLFFSNTLGLAGRTLLETLCGNIPTHEQLYGSRPQDLKKCKSKSNYDVIKFLEQSININKHAVENNLDNETKNKKFGSNSLIISVKKLHKDYLASHGNSPVGYEKFKKIYKDACKVSIQQSGNVGPKERVSTSSLAQNLPRSQKLRRGGKSLSVDNEENDCRVPKIRRSTRITRMQGSMAEENFGEPDAESNIEPNHVTLHTMPIMEQKLHQIYSRKHNLKTPEKLIRSHNIADQHHSIKSQTSSKELETSWHHRNQDIPIATPVPVLATIEKFVYSEKSSAATSLVIAGDKGSKRQSLNSPSKEEQDSLTLDRATFCYKNRGSRKTEHEQDTKKKEHASDGDRKKKIENCKQGEESSLSNSNNHQTKTAHISKKSCQLIFLKKKLKYPMLPSCDCSRRKCINNISEERRREIYAHFWNLRSYRDRLRWLIKYVERRERKIKVLSLFPRQKNQSKIYYLPAVNGQKKEVCRLFFIHTLGFRWDSVIDAAMKTKPLSTSGVWQSQTLKKPLHQLPEYVVDSVKQYLKCVLDSSSETISDTQKESANNYKENDMIGLKVKDLFKDWKIKFKSLKFNLGYHSFRRIFQSVVDPVVNLCEEASCKHGDDRISDDGSVAHDVDEETRLLPVTETLYPEPDSQNNQRCETANSSQETTLDSTTILDCSYSTVATTKACNEFSVSSSQFQVGTDRKPLQRGDMNVSLRNEDSCCSAQSTSLTHDIDNCFLDVGSGYFKQTGSGSSIDFPYTCGDKYRKRRSLSVRNDRNNYPVLPPCKCSKRKCFEKFTEAHRQKINDLFWSLGGYNERKQWILEHIKRADIKRRVVLNEGQPRKLESRWYYLPDSESNRVEVCKAFFLRTLGYRWDSVIDTIGKTTPKGEKLVVPDRRGRKPPPHKITEEAVNSMTLYIENVCNVYQPLSPQKSQSYKRGSKPIPSSIIPHGLTVKQLFDDYKSKHPEHKFGYESFRKVFQKVHCAFLDSLPDGCSLSEELETKCSETVASVNEDYSEPANVECSSCFQEKDANFIPTREPYSDISHYSQSPPLPPSSHHAALLPQQVDNNVPEHTSYLYQFSSQVCESQQPQSLPIIQASDKGPQLQSLPVLQTSDSGSHLQSLPVMQNSNSGGPLLPVQYNSISHDPFMKFNHNLYNQSTGASGHFSQGTDNQGYSSSINHHKNSDPAACGGPNQYPQYFVPNPEPLHRQVYPVASQYPSILHHFAGPGRFFNYGNFPSQNATFHGGHDKQYNYIPQTSFHRDNINPYIPRTSHSFSTEALTVQTQYSVPHFPHNSIQTETATALSPYQHENNNTFVHDDRTLVTKHLDINNSFDTDFMSGAKERKSPSRDKSLPKKKTTADKPKIKKERKIRPKSIRNFGEHYPILPPCHCKKKKCTEKFSDSDRQRIHDMFWDLKDYNERKQWMLFHIKREDCKRRRIDQFESFRKQESRWYFFPDVDGNLNEVCKDYFLRTLGYRWDSVIDTIRRTTPKGETNTRPDQRGRKAPAHKLSSVVLRSVVQYIQSMHQVSKPVKLRSHVKGEQPQKFEKVCSEDSSQDTTNSVSIPYGLTMKDLYDDYKVKHAGHKIGYESFRRIFRAISRSEKIILDDALTEDDLLNTDDQALVNF